MEKRTFGKVITALFFITMGISGALADPVIRADLDKTSYMVGDLATVRVTVNGNTGMHGVFFDLGYDASLFSFVNLVEADLPRAVAAVKTDAAHLLHAVADPATSAVRGSHVIVSFAMNDSASLTVENGTLVEVVFRVIAVPGNGSKPRFSFNAASAAMGLAGAKLGNTRFVGSSDISISAGTGAYVQINSPVDNQAVYEDTAALYATSTAAANYSYVITNRDAGYTSQPISAQTGSLNGYRVPVSFGINRLRLELRKDQTVTMAYDEIVAFRSEDEVYVKIVSPIDHAMVNTDEVRVLATSPFPSVTINGQAAELLGEKRDGKNLFASVVWLKKGFNVIKAQSVGPQDIVFTNSITVYYQRDDQLFKFLAPDADSVIKTIGSDPQLNKGSLRVRGEIGSDTQENGLPNRVTLRVIYTPTNPGISSSVLVDNKEMTVSENTLGGLESEAPYVFTNAFPIPVIDLDNGELEIIAHKNKSGTKSDAELHRFVKLDRNKLAIDLIQPNVFGTDVLDSAQKFTAFNGAAQVDWGNLVLGDNAAIGLAPVNCEIKNQTGLAGLTIESLIATKDGSRYALVNTSREMRIYRKGPEATAWSEPILKNSSMHGYALCETDVGLLVGVSNLSSSGNSGLYLFADGKLMNVVIGEPIAHVQFIEYRDGYAYIYGNGYSHLYSFNVFSLQETTGNYKADVVAKIPCANDLFLKQFVLGEDAKTAFLLDNDGRLSVMQNLWGTGYERIAFNASAVSSEASFAAVIPGTYRSGTYRAYLLVSRNGAANSQVLMENMATNRLIPSAGLATLAVPDEQLIGAGFADDRFALLYKKRTLNGFVYTIRKANILFNQVGFETTTLSEYPSLLDIAPGQGNAFAMLAGDGSFTYGQNANLALPACYEFVKNFPASGEVRFNYKNPDAERIDGFSFYVDSSWLTESGIQLGFGAFTSGGSFVFGSTGFSSSESLTLPAFLDMKNDLVKVTHSYDADRGKELVKATFTDPAAGRYLSFLVRLSAVAGRNRSISEFTVYKKKAVKLPRSGEAMVLPISGFVTDRTAHEIQIQEKTVALESNGYFLHFYELKTTQETTTINLSCSNEGGERITMPFTVKIFDSVNEIKNVQLETSAGAIEPGTEASEFTTDQESLTVSADVFGMEGCVAGYETYAYVTVNGTARLELLSSGVFDYVSDSPIDSQYDKYGSGYVSGHIVKQTLSLYPGIQRMVLFVENPGGKRAEYTIDGKYPEVEYALPLDRQKILIQNSEVKPLGETVVVSGVAIDQAIELTLRESTAAPYIYTRKYTLKGRVNSITRFNDLQVKTNNAAVRFADGTQTTIIEVDQLNRFEVDVYITLSEEVDSAKYAVLFIPTTPYLEPMKTGVILEAEKDYTGAYIVPSFSPMDAANWSVAELTSCAKSVRVRIARHVPTGASLSLLVNFETAITGMLAEDGVGTKLYKLLDEDRKEVFLTGLKNGMNRVQWTLARNTTISSSSYSKAGMDDYTLELHLLNTYAVTDIVFDVDQKTYYAAPLSGEGRVALPSLQFQKHVSTTFAVKLNGETLYLDEGTEAGTIDPSTSAALRQGRNELVVEYTEKDSAPQTRSFVFLYDSEVPTVRIADYRYVRSGDGQYLASLSAIVQEANIFSVELIERNEGIESNVGASGYAISSMGNDTYELRWNNLDQNNPLLNPTPTDVLFVRITDHADNIQVSNVFEGMAKLPPVEEAAIRVIPIGTMYEGVPTFEEEASHWGATNFPARLKIYSAEMELPSLDISASDGNYTINRSGSVRLGTVIDRTAGKTVTVNAGGSVKFAPGFSIPRGTKLNVRKPTMDAVNPVSPMLRFRNAEPMGQFGVSFWLRIENEGEYAEDHGYKKILTVAQGTYGNPDAGGDVVDYEVYLAYRDNIHGSTGDETLALIERQKLRGSTEAGYDRKVVLLGESTDATTLSRNGSAGWNLVTVSVDVGSDNNGLSPFYRLSVNGNQPVQGMHSSLSNGNDMLVDVTGEDLCHAILDKDREHDFGCTNGSESSQDTTQENGHYSIARPFYVNKSITNKDVEAMADRIATAFAAINDTSDLPKVDMTLRYDFTRTSDLGPLSTAGTRFEQLRLVGPIHYYHAPQEDALYGKSEAIEAVGGSLRASSLRVNRIVGSADGMLMFRDAAKYLTDGLRATSGINENAEWIILEPVSAILAGRYAFANNYTSHTLMNAECYSIYGKVAPFIPGTVMDATLVVSINGIVQRYRFEEGDFHFDFRNPDGITPSRVSMYIETKTPIKLGKNFFFTEGNFRLPDEAFASLPATCATTKNIFQKTGTIEFWYKPMIADKGGFVDYNVTLFDSELVQISSELVGGHAVLVASVKKNGSPMRSAAPLLAGWQHIQFSWSRMTGSHLACLYLNGQIVSKLQGTDVLPLSPSMEGTAPATDNVTIGANMAQTQYANGYLDEVRIDNVYDEARYVSRQPITSSYTDGFDSASVAHPALAIGKLDSGSEVEDFSLVLLDANGKTVYENKQESAEAPGLDIKRFNAGVYTLLMKAKVNGYRFTHTYRFMKNDRPRFISNECTGIVVNGEPTDLRFEFQYDTSYLHEDDLLNRLAGLEFIVCSNDKGTAQTRRYVVFQKWNDTHTELEWFIANAANFSYEEPLVVENNEFAIAIPGVLTTEAVDWSFRPFYFEDQLNLHSPLPPGSVTDDCRGTIPFASFSVTKMPLVPSKIDPEYKIEVRLDNMSLSSPTFIDAFTVEYVVRSNLTGATSQSETPVHFSRNGQLFLYYDDMMAGLGYGEYEAYFTLRYNKREIRAVAMTLNWQASKWEDDMPTTERRLAITEFSLLQIQAGETSDTANLYLEYEHSGLFEGMDANVDSVDILYDLSVLKKNVNGSYSKTYERTAVPIADAFQAYSVIQGVPISKSDSIVKISVYDLTVSSGGSYSSLVSKAELPVVNRIDPPQVFLTNSVPSRIAYNNVKFSWTGYYHNEFRSDIKYSYNLDDKGWSSVNAEWRSVEYFNLSEGSHKFAVRAHFGSDDNTSAEVVSLFFIDVSRPVIDTTGKITVDRVVDGDGFTYAVNLRGAAASIVDSSLSYVLVNGASVELNRKDGSFVAKDLPVTVDGINKYTISAYDLVGNRTEKTIEVDNTITELLYPAAGSKIRYTPITVVGRLPQAINKKVEIYIRDPLTKQGSALDHSGWHKARMNEDYTFFVEDVTLTPGTYDREAHTVLELAVVTQSGHAYTKEIDVSANEVERPIDLALSLHAAEGERAETKVTLSAKAKVANISSWSVDFTGDGIYDDVAIMDDSEHSKSYSWTHTYSALGVFKPRVRVITKAGVYFSVDDTLTIHEKIKEASNKMVANPLSLDALTMADGTQRLYALAGKDGATRIEVYEIGRNESYVSNKLYEVPLTGKGIKAPVRVCAVDGKTILVAENVDGAGILHTLTANEFGQYDTVASAKLVLTDAISDMDCDGENVFITLQNSGAIVTAAFVNGNPDPASMVSRTVATLDGKPLGGKMGISKDEYGILLSDYYHQRIVRLTNAFTPLEYVGEQGTAEGQFIKPSFVRSHQNRLFVYDEGRSDVQFFDPQFKPITRLVYDPADADGNYLDSGFLQDVVGISVFTRTESEKLFYYATLLSRSSGFLSVIRMPQWEDMRATVRNNKIIFLKDNEVYAAKPSGSDLTRLISSDSIPRINGSADYPALSSDGRMIAFTSRAKLLDGSGETASGSTYAYDSLYVMNVDGTGLQRIPLSDIAKYEIERPQFNSNGTQLAFSAKPTGGNWQLYTYTFGTGAVVNLLKSKENARFPYFSPDDRFIVFSTDYDGDEEIQIYDTLNPTMRVSVTDNASRDSFPVWNTVYPEEIADPDVKIESKIAFVSERNGHKGVYYAYVSRKSEADVRIVTVTGQETGSKPDTAAIELTKTGTEGDYPCFTGDGKQVVYENYDGLADELIAYDYPLKSTARIDLLRGSRRPAGMKNAIARFSAEVDGNSIRLNWSRYTDADVFYTIRFRESLDGAKEVEKRVFTQDQAFLTGLEMGMDYLVRVSIEEKGEEAASTQWKKVHMPEVVARPSYKIDADNPYIVHLYAWTPNDEADWGYIWIIDNQELASQSNAYMNYQFATSGIKSIALKVRNKANTYSDTSSPMAVPIVSDIVPVITYLLTEDRSTIQLSPDNSIGKNVDYSSILWTITGAGSATPLTATVRRPTLDISAFRNKINVSLRLSRIHVNNQANTDTLESNVPVDLYYRGTKLVITQEANAASKRLIAFSGAQSVGNFEWRESQWCVFRNGTTVFQTSGSSSFAYEFPETDEEATYSVSLTVLSKNDAQSHTATNLVTIKSTPIEPEIDYEIVTMKDPSDTVVGAKIIFSATNSKGNNIDFTQAKWTVPVAASYGDEPVQVGPTAVYNLFNAGSVSQVEVTLSLMRKGETKPVTLTKTINIEGNQVARPKLVVKTDTRTAESGSVIEMNVLSSTGANIDWEKTSWQVSTAIDGLVQDSVQQGPAARLLVGASAQKVKVRYTVTLYFYGATKPLVSSGEVEVGAKTIKPVIGVEKVSGGEGNVYNFSVAETAGTNIDWDRTTWYFYDGNTVVTQKNGALVTHAFTRKGKATGYPVVAVMYFKNGSSPFYGYKAVDIDADEFIPVISWDRAEAIAASEILFGASGSLGANIDWAQAKWNFGDGSAPQYGAAASHQYPISSASKEYRVSLTLTRTLANVEAETATSSTIVNAARDVVKPVVKAKLYRDGYLVLSSEESEGRGLLLNQSAWMFAGKGDSSSINISAGSETSSGTTSSSSWDLSASATTGWSEGLIATETFGVSFSTSNSSSSSDSTSLNSTDAFSNENYHIGMTARRWIGDYDIYAARYDTQKTITVSLNVFRQDADGGVVGKTITVNVNLADAVNGVSYR